MKQYTTPEQTAKLIEMGLDMPCSIASVEPIYGMGGISVAKAYSIGELIEMLPTSAKIKGYDCFLYIEPNHYDGGWDVGYMRYSLELNQIATELIDALYDMVIKLKEEGVI